MKHPQRCEVCHFCQKECTGRPEHICRKETVNEFGMKEEWHPIQECVEYWVEEFGCASYRKRTGTSEQGWHPDEKSINE